ncbi:hypothetical protein PNEG_02596 [Pneumocystis murina B123]|uniref:SANT domain-containing protein n=1 Tax=Pneumocystis murina (strain B123) TaxID=1069680 RepID=M7NPU4_PNEMU|nr:hypothetical protein PNEG_02596 [Pneumocystis murina B123]EMR09262.1 hypothetical protein PNEG_02596 [Pneumocystis murina B123]
MEKKYGKEREYSRNNTCFHDQENIFRNRDERLSVLGSRSLYQNYSLEKRGQRFNSTCPNIIPQGSRYSYFPLYHCGRKKKYLSSFYKHCSEQYSYLPFYHARRNRSSDFEYFSEQVKNNNGIDRSNKYEKDIDRNGYMSDLSKFDSNLTVNNALNKYHDQSFDSYISIGSSKMNGSIKRSMYYKNISKEKGWSRSKDFYKNFTKKFSRFEYEKDDNYRTKTSINDFSLGITKNVLFERNAAKKNDIHGYYNNISTISSGLEDCYFDQVSKDGTSLGGKSENIVFLDDTKLQSPFFPPSSDIVNDINKDDFDSDSRLSFFPDTKELGEIFVKNEENMQELIQKEAQFMDQKAPDFRNTSLDISCAINDSVIFQDSSHQEDNSNLDQKDIHIKIQGINEAILTYEKRFHEIENKLETKVINEDKIFPSKAELPNLLAGNYSSNLETNICSRIYSENKEKAEQNCIKFSYFKISDSSLNGYSFLKENEIRHKRLRPFLLLHISRKNKKIFEKNKVLLLQYQKYQSFWESHVERLDNIKNAKKKDIERYGSLDSHVDSLSLRSFRRGQGLNYGDFVRSDADFEDIIAKLGVEDDRICRAAVIPPMILDPEESVRYKYDDRNRVVDDPISSFHYPTSIDIWTAEEHTLFKELFIKYPQKNFGLIASSIPNKTISQCVLHYYRTKKQENYKSLIMSRNSDRIKKKGRGRSSKKMEKAKVSSLLADLQPRIINDDIDDYEKD